MVTPPVPGAASHPLHQGGASADLNAVVGVMKQRDAAAAAASTVDAPLVPPGSQSWPGGGPPAWLLAAEVPELRPFPPPLQPLPSSALQQGGGGGSRAAGKVVALGTSLDGWLGGLNAALLQQEPMPPPRIGTPPSLALSRSSGAGGTGTSSSSSSPHSFTLTGRGAAGVDGGGGLDKELKELEQLVGRK